MAIIDDFTDDDLIALEEGIRIKQGRDVSPFLTHRHREAFKKLANAVHEVEIAESQRN